MVEIKSKGDFSDPSTYEIQMSVTINSVLLGQNHTHLFPYCLGLPLTHRETIQPVKLETFTIWRFTGSLPTPVLALGASREWRPGRHVWTRNTLEALA